MTKENTVTMTYFDVVDVEDQQLLGSYTTRENADRHCPLPWGEVRERTETYRVGDGATVAGYSDSYACTIVEISKSGKTIVLREDHADLLNGVDSGADDAMTFTPGGFVGHWEGQQRYSYKPNPNGRVIKASFRKKVGRFVESGLKPEQGGSVSLGIRAKHHDYNF